ncbi:NAD(P)H-dependent oxidoreductase [Sulfitobacter albidus]|uniref:FMN dependent NADH:quinone oxidoreductase n=1 Tax=Sulfitobacter albidus TaxID=2829501 RepID=A0A975JC64_9RHOB|nr:NAD(P)H-dependent oxidoreductase [Sulfitobacter albidus]QUJ75794.1 NAD(P)H-dependent oxidoreductase [Sulfitobacter albidus]
MSILHITSSANPGVSTSTLLGAEAAAKIGGPVTTRDVTHGLRPIDAAWIAANVTPETDRDPAARALLAQSDALVAELQAHDTLILSTPLYNFGVTAALKNWIDLICRAGQTFRYTDAGPQGLLHGKRAVIIVATGGTPAEGPLDFATPYLRQIMTFIGITDVTCIAADRLMADADRAMEDARARIAAL